MGVTVGTGVGVRTAGGVAVAVAQGDEVTKAGSDVSIKVPDTATLPREIFDYFTP